MQCLSSTVICTNNYIERQTTYILYNLKAVIITDTWT